MQACPVPLLLECPADAEKAQTVVVLNTRLQERDAQLAEAKDEKGKLHAEISRLQHELTVVQEQQKSADTTKSQQLVDSQRQMASLQEQLQRTT